MRWDEIQGTLYLQVHILHFNFDDMATIHPSFAFPRQNQKSFTCSFDSVSNTRWLCRVFLNGFYSNCPKIFSRSFVWSCNDRRFNRAWWNVHLFLKNKMEKATDVCYAFFLLNDYINGLERMVKIFSFSPDLLYIFSSIRCFFSGDWIYRPTDNVGICSPFFQSIDFL